MIQKRDKVFTEQGALKMNYVSILINRLNSLLLFSINNLSYPIYRQGSLITITYPRIDKYVGIITQPYRTIPNPQPYLITRCYWCSKYFSES